MPLPVVVKAPGVVTPVVAVTWPVNDEVPATLRVPVPVVVKAPGVVTPVVAVTRPDGMG